MAFRTLSGACNSGLKTHEFITIKDTTLVTAIIDFSKLVWSQRLQTTFEVSYFIEHSSQQGDTHRGLLIFNGHEPRRRLNN